MKGGNTLQPLGYRPNFVSREVNPYEQRFLPLIPFIGGLAGGLIAGGLLARPLYGYYPPPYGYYSPPYGLYPPPYGSYPPPYYGMPY